MVESDHIDGEEPAAAPAEAEGDGIGLTHILVDVADKSTPPAQVNTRLKKRSSIIFIPYIGTHLSFVAKCNNQSTNQSISQSFNKYINQLMDQSITQ